MQNLKSTSKITLDLRRLTTKGHHSDQRAILGDLLISGATDDLSEKVLEQTDIIFREEQKNRKAIPFADLLRYASPKIQPRSGTAVVVWRGDIRELKVDAIVNAANAYGLGCFVPHHKCIDNLIHRAAGPRLRRECARAMETRGSLLTAGTPPIVTAGYFLHCKKVLHVTGPQLPRHQGQASAKQEANLVAAYENCLNACRTHGLRSIAFPCISTGLFGYPVEAAARVALKTVYDWLENNEGVLDAVVFDVFDQPNTMSYRRLAPQIFGKAVEAVKAPLAQPASELKVPLVIGKAEPPNQGMLAAAFWLSQADAVVICAGAGMSIGSPEEALYTNPKAFSKHYPVLRRRFGFKTAGETMGLASDIHVPVRAKWGYWCRHYRNMRFRYPPNAGYGELLSLTSGKETFVWTSNVDGCFERAGFDPKKIYTPQGDASLYQCIGTDGSGPCSMDSVFPGFDELSRELVSFVDPKSGEIPSSKVPLCSKCGGDTFLNLRAGSWFLPTRHNAAGRAFEVWIEGLRESKKRIVILEVGAGFSTPTVTRFPMESLAYDLGAALIRINPNDHDIPLHLPRAVGISAGWDTALPELTRLVSLIDDGTEGTKASAALAAEYYTVTHKAAAALGRRHLTWKEMLRHLMMM